MQTATIEYPEEVRLALNLQSDQMSDEIRIAAATKLFALGRLSSGRAAQLAGVSRVRFLHELDRFGVASITIDESELVQDIANAKPNGVVCMLYQIPRRYSICTRPSNCRSSKGYMAILSSPKQ
jgi:predicted HTH domain antitoxin